MAENNQIFEDLNGKGDKVFRAEHDLYKELLEFEKALEAEDKVVISRIIDFYPDNKVNTRNKKTALRLAAESTDMKVSKLRNKSDFLVSSEGTYALKYSIVENEELQLNLLGESILDPEEFILYSVKLNKYFISNLKGDFLIGQYANFNMTDFDFKAISSIDKVILFRIDNNYTTLPLGSASPEILTVDDSFLRIKIHNVNDISTVVLATSKTKDFVKMNNRIIEIPIILLEDKSLLYLY